MSIDLKDFRGRITPETHCVLEGVSRVTGQDRQEIVRQVLHDWALERLRIAKVTDQMLRAEGLAGIAEGGVGNRRESAGARGRAED